MSTKVEFGVMQKLLVTEVTDDGRAIFVQLDTPDAYQVQDLSREIETHVSERNQDQVNFDPGSRCYAHASDGVLYRALVVKQDTVSTATVYFADYGNSEEVSVSDIYPPSGSYFDLPTQALCCTLSDFVPNHSNWTDTIKDILSEKLVNQEVYGIFRSLSSHPHPHADAVLQDKDRYPSYNVTLFQDEAGSVSYSLMLVELGLGQFAICNENVSVGNTEKVYVAFSDSPGRFWLQLSNCSATLSLIDVTLADEAIVSSLQALPREAVFTGAACCVVFADDGVFYRANIIEVKGQKVEVQFVDYGNSTTVTTADLLEIPPSLSVIPAQATQCCLEGVRPLKKDWTTESCDAFANGTTDVELDAHFVDELTHEVFTVDLLNPETGSTISEMLVSSHCAQSSNQSSILGEPPKLKPVLGMIQQSLPKEYTLGKMEIGNTYGVTVTHLESPSVVWAQINSHAKVFRDMMTNMEMQYLDVGSIPGLAEAAPGQPCAAQFADDGRWYRGRIDAVDDSSTRARVLFVDFGNCEVFKISSLKQLQPELILLPTQAVSFSMYGLVPADRGKVWPAKTMSSFVKMTSSGVFQCEVVELDGDGYPAVRLRDGRGRNVGEELVKMGLAGWTEEESKSRSHQQIRSPRDSSAVSGSREGSARGEGSAGGRERYSDGGSREGGLAGRSGARDGGSTRGSGSSREQSTRESREVSTHGSSGVRESTTRRNESALPSGGSRESSTHGSPSGSRDASARGNRPTPPSLSSHTSSLSQQRSPLHPKILSPIHTGAGQPPSTKQSPYSSLSLEVEQSYDMMVIYVNALQDFHVQLKKHEPQLTALMEEIGSYCSSNEARMPDNFEIGRPVLAQFTDDQEWYRAIITERNHGVSVVTFVDYGNQDTLRDSSLIDIPPRFLPLPAQAIRCSLEGVGVQVSPEAAKTAFNDLTLEQEGRGVVKSVFHDPRGPTYTIDLTLSDSTKPVTALVEGGHISIPKSTLSNLSPSSSPTLTEVKVPSFPTHTHIDVCLSYVESPEKFFLQLLDNFSCVEELTQGMNEIYSQMTQRDEVLFSLNEGVFCAAKFSEDGVWYRARIVSVGGATATVRFVDYGNDDVVAASDLKSLRVQFAAESCLAIQCHLDSVPTEVASSQEVMERFVEYVTSGTQLVAEFLKPFSSYSESIPVRLFDTSVPNSEQDIANILRKVHSRIGQPPSQSGSDETANTPAPPKTGLTSTKTSLTPVEPPVLNQSLEGVVTHVENPSEIYFQLGSSTQQAEDLLGQLYTFYAEQDAGKKVEGIEIGTLCSAPFTDGSWYRARVTGVSSEEASVQYIDYGNSAVVAVGDLKSIDPQFLSEAPHALRCSLNGIRPMGSREGEWGDECCAALTETILDQNCSVVISSFSDGICKAQMTVADSDISQMLISRGLATADVPQPMEQPVSTPVPTPVAAEFTQDRDYLAIPPFSVQVGSDIEVFVTFCDFPRVLYCQSATTDPRFEMLTDEMQQHCNSDSSTVVAVDDVIIDDVILAQYSEDLAWYRAQVKEILEDSVRVLFVDYGNCEKTDSLRAISAKFCFLPAQAVPCSIVDWSNFDPCDDSGCGFNDSLASDDSGFSLRFIEVHTTGEKSVVQLTGLGDGVSVLDHACEAGILVRSTPTSAEGRGVVATATSFPPVVVETNSREDGYVSHIESPESFWLQLTCNESELNSLTERLAAVYGNSSNLAKLDCPDMKPGQACCAQFSDDMQWYRSIVNDITSDGVGVHFVDYGNGEIVSHDRIKTLKQEFLKAAPQAVHCSLIGIVPPTGASWSDESITGFSSFVLEKAVSAEFVNESEKGVWSVMLTCENTDVVTVIIREGFALSKIRSQSHPPSDQPSQISPGDPENFDVGSDSAPVIIPEITLEEGEKYEVYISHTGSPGEFYCQLMNNEEIVNVLMASVGDFYANQSPRATLEVGRYCVAQYSGNKAWHRARIVGIEREGEGERMVMVQFVDFGNCESVASSQVFGLSPTLVDMAQQAFCCSLVEDPSIQFADETIARFLEIDTELCYRVLVRRCLDDGRYLVELSDFNGEILNDRILNRALVSPQLTWDPSFKNLSCPVSAVDVYVSFIDSPTSFYCQPLNLTADLETMMQCLADTVAGGNVEPLESVCPGAPCLAQFSDDNEWYRARVESVSDNGTTDIVVHFVDYGNSESTTLSSLLKCPPSLFKEPIQAFHCSVFDTSTSAGVDEWSDESIEVFRGLLGEEALSLTVTEFERESGWCVCSLSSNGHPIDFSSLLPSPTRQPGEEDSSRVLSAPGNQEIIEGLASDAPYASSASSSSLPATAVTVTTSDGKTSEHSAGTSENGRGASNERGLLSEGNLESSSAANMNFSTLALKGSSHGSGEDGLSDTESSEETSDQGGGEGEPLIKAPFTLTLSIPEEFEAAIVYVESPSFLFIQRRDCQAELEKLSLEIEQYCASFAEKQHQEVFHEGDFVLARYTGKVWYRAKVVEAGSGPEFHVFFIDFGNSSVIPPDLMVMCPENYLELPCQAIACSLANVPRRDSWPDEYKNLIDKQVSDRTVRVKVVHPASKGMRPAVNIEDLESGADVAQAVLNYLQDECEQGNMSNYVIPEEAGEEEGEESHEQVTPKVDVVASTEQPTVAQPATEASLTHASANRSVQTTGTSSVQPTSTAVQPTGTSISQSRASIPERRLEIGAAYDAYVVSCDTPHSFFIQLSTDSEALENMSSELESTYENTETSNLKLLTPPSVGDHVCAQFSEDQKWYRARVMGFDTTDSNKVELLFVDYGNSEIGSISNLRSLSPSLPSHPPLAVECFLAGLEAPEGQDGFSADATEHLLELTGQGETECKFEVQFSDSAGHYGVNLYGGEGVNVAESLIDAHLATALQDTPTTAASNDNEITPDQSELVSSGAPQSSEQLELTEDPLAVKDTTEQDQSEDVCVVRYPTQPLEPGTTHNAIITSITSLDEFHCQLTDRLEDLDVLMESIASREYQIGDDVLRVAASCEGFAVCACYSEEDVWYRAIVTDVLSQERVRVKYVDYGNAEEVDMSRVKLLKKEFADALPPLMVQCSLAPLTDRDLDPARPEIQGSWELTWPSECVTNFQEMVGEEGEVRLVMGEGGSEDGSVRVRVFVSVDGREVDVRETIIAKLLESQKSKKELLSATEEADGGYGDSVTEEGDAEGGERGGENPAMISERKKTEKRGLNKQVGPVDRKIVSETGDKKSDVAVLASNSDEDLEEIVKRMADVAIAEAQQDMKQLADGEGEFPSVSRED